MSKEHNAWLVNLSAPLDIPQDYDENDSMKFFRSVVNESAVVLQSSFPPSHDNDACFTATNDQNMLVFHLNNTTKSRNLRKIECVLIFLLMR